MTEEQYRGLGEMMGNFIEYDGRRKSNQAPNFIRIRVEIDTSQSIRRGIRIGSKDSNRWLEIKYEKLPNYCYWCGGFDHVERECVVAFDDDAKEGDKRQFEKLRVEDEFVPFTKFANSQAAKRENGRGKPGIRNVFVSTVTKNTQRVDIDSTPVVAKVKEVTENAKYCQVESSSNLLVMKPFVNSSLENTDVIENTEIMNLGDGNNEQVENQFRTNCVDVNPKEVLVGAEGFVCSNNVVLEEVVLESRTTLVSGRRWKRHARDVGPNDLNNSDPTLGKRTI